MKNYILAFLFALVGFLLNTFANQFNGPYFDIGYLVAPPFLYYLTLALYPKVKEQRHMYHILGILGGITVYIVIATWFNIDRITPVFITTLISSLFMYLIAKIIYGKRALK